MDRVHECQTPFFRAVEADPDGTVSLYFDVPAESPTVRGYASILYEGSNGARLTSSSMRYRARPFGVTHAAGKRAAEYEEVFEAAVG